MNRLTSTQPLRDRLWLRVPAAVAAVALSYGIRVLLGSAAQGFPFVIFIPPVVLVTFCFGTTRYARGSAKADELPELAYLPKSFTLAARATKVRDALDAAPHERR